MTSHARHVLVVDDSRDFLDFMKAFLSAEGFDVATAQSPEAIRDALRAGRPDLVIADVRMPGLAPFGVLDLVAAEEHLRDLPILFCTGAVQEIEDAAERLRRPHTDVIAKPFDIDEILIRIDQLCPPLDRPGCEPRDGALDG